MAKLFIFSTLCLCLLLSTSYARKMHDHHHDHHDESAVDHHHHDRDDDQKKAGDEAIHTEGFPFDDEPWQCPPSWLPFNPYIPLIPGCVTQYKQYLEYYNLPDPTYQYPQPQPQPQPEPEPVQPYQPPQGYSQDCMNANNIISTCAQKDQWSYSWSYSIDQRCCTAAISVNNVNACSPEVGQWIEFIRSQCPQG